jgi:hypothetical protein
MIISHTHKFIFLHCRKAAGSSIVVSLSRFLGPEDLQLSAILDTFDEGFRPPRRVIREAILGFTLGDYISLIAGRRSYSRQVSNSIKRRYMKVLGRGISHSPASVVAANFPKEWDNYYKICVVRNPWEKTVSDYFWRTRNLIKRPSLEQYIEALESNNALGGIVPSNHDNWPLYTINDHVMVDRVVRYENLHTELSKALANTSIQWDGWLPRKKANRGVVGGRRTEYRSMLSASSIATIRKLYAKEIEYFDYQM